jgi:hypothetical protein
MIISASRRTDIPAFYSEWFIRRVRAGYCEVVNPMNPRQVTKISLGPDQVDVIVFWTRSPRAMIRKLPELDARGARYYFQFSLLGYPKEIEPCSPSVCVAVETFKRLADRIGADKLIWRYDPIFLSNITDVDFHLRNFESLARALSGFTHRCVISMWDDYRKLAKRLRQLEDQGVQVRQPQPGELDRLISGVVRISVANGMEIVSCAEEHNLERYGIRPGKCIDDVLIQRLFGVEVCHRKDQSQRAVCCCVQSRDIGAYDTCLFGCTYCYATTSFSRAAANHRRHDPDSPTLIPAGVSYV